MNARYKILITQRFINGLKRINATLEFKYHFDARKCIVKYMRYYHTITDVLCFYSGFNITSLWDRYHSHLVPIQPSFNISGLHLSKCPVCKRPKSLRIIAHIRLGPNKWVRSRTIKYCFDCKNYFLPIQALWLFYLRSIAELLCGGICFSKFREYLKPTGIDARLWLDASAILNLEPTTRCNFNCWYCVGRHMKQEDLSFQDFKLILNNSPNIRLLSLVGEGEPLMHPEFFRMVNHAKQKNIIVFTTTNGSFLSDKNIAMLCDSKIDCISISIDSTDPKQFAESRAGGGLDNIWDGIESLILHRDRLKLGYPKVAIKGTLFKHSEDQLTKIIAEARKRGMDYVEAFQTLSQKKTYSELYPADKRDMLKDCRSVHAYIKYYMRDGTKNLPSINEIIAHNEEHDSDRMRKQHQKKAKTNILRGNCDIGWTYSLLSGDITPCCAIKSPVNKEFNLKEDSLGSILKNKNYENIRFNLWNGLFLKDCEGCGKIF